MTKRLPVDVRHLTFNSTAFPAAEDMKLWHSLSPAEQYAAVMRDVHEGLHGPAAENTSREELMVKVMTQLTKTPTPHRE